MANIAAPRPFRVEIPQENVDRLKRLVEDTRLPDRPFTEGVSWNYGTDLDWLKSMRKEWIENFDWRQVEAEMNQFPQFKVTIESVDVHFIHQRSERADAIPLILLHGWPGSFWEFHKVIEPLTNPPAEQPAFHVVVPSLPGFGFSSPPPKQEWGMDDNARVFDRLMTGVLGYESYMAEAGDFGALVATYLGTNEYPSCKLLNICATPANPTIGALLTLPFWLLPVTWRQWLYSKIYTEDERKGLSRVRDYLKTGLGYFIEQATQPMTIGYALHDSPIGLLAWIGEKYHELVDPEVLPTATNFILTTVSLYYLTGSFVTSTLPYHENTKTFSKTLRIVKPLGVSHFPYDCLNVPLGWIKSQHRNVVFYRHHTRGGHFPAFEVPELLVSDVRELLVAQRSAFD